MSELSSLFYMSESSISKYVMDVTGLTFSDLVNEMRIVKMMDLLMYTDMTLNELAELTGFVDASHVLKVFSARTGVTPKEYRKIYAGTNNLFKEREKSVSFEVFNYIYHNFQEDLKIQAVADKFGVTVVELNRILLFQAERNFEDFFELPAREQGVRADALHQNEHHRYRHRGGLQHGENVQPQFCEAEKHDARHVPQAHHPAARRRKHTGRAVCRMTRRRARRVPGRRQGEAFVWRR